MPNVRPIRRVLLKLHCADVVNSHLGGAGIWSYDRKVSPQHGIMKRALPVRLSKTASNQFESISNLDIPLCWSVHQHLISCNPRPQKYQFGLFLVNVPRQFHQFRSSCFSLESFTSDCFGHFNLSSQMCQVVRLEKYSRTE